MKNLIKQNKAITLIALVVTIIVILILAGVTIQTLTDDNGLLTKTSNAQKETLRAEGLEKLQVEVLGSYTTNGEIDTNQLRTNLQNIVGIKTVNDEEINDSTTLELPIVVKINGNEYLIKANGSTKAKYGIDEFDVAKNPDKYYGKYVTNYNSQNDSGIVASDGQKWKIFMADEDNIYLIASNYITAEYTGTKNNVAFNYTEKTSTGMNFTDILKEYNASTDMTKNDIPKILSKLNKQTIYHKWMNNSDNQKRNYPSEKAVAAMLDVDVWSGYNNTTYAQYAIGGPTIEMFCKSYNDTHTGDKLEAQETNEDNTYGYKIKKGNANSGIKITELGSSLNYLYFHPNCYYWIASPTSYNSLSALFYIKNGQINFTNVNNNASFRPLVCLKSNVHLVENEDGETYSLELD